MRDVYIRLIFALLRALLPTMKKKAAESKNEIDNAIVEIIDSIIRLYYEGGLTF